MTKRNLRCLYRGWRVPAFSLLLLCLFFANAQQAAAYLNLSVDLERDSYLRYEPIPVNIKIENYSGNTLRFVEREGQEGRIFFRVRRFSNQTISPKEGDINFGEDLYLPPGETRELEVALNQHYNLQRPGDYELQARVTHPSFSGIVVSEEKSFSVREGEKLWQRRVGVPAGVGEDIPSREMTLFSFGQGEDAFYALRIEDEEVVYATVRLGRRIRGYTPEYAVDARSNFHILNQIKARLYIYRVIDYDGEIKQTIALVADNNIPTLEKESTLGSVRVKGGRRVTPGQRVELDHLRPRMGGEAPTRSPSE